MNYQQIKSSFQREIWESQKTFVWTPIVMAALFFVLLAFELLTANDYQMENIGNLIKLAQYPDASEQLDRFGFLLVQVVMGIFLSIAGLSQLRYFLSCLFDERRDLSIYFWRSLPVSDLQNIIVKFVTGALVIPITFILAAMALIFVGFSFFLILMSITLSGPDIGVWQFASSVNLLTPIMSVFLSIIPMTLWMFPIFAWLMLASMIAGRAPFLWALLPIVFVMLAEVVIVKVFNSGDFFFVYALRDYLSISPELLAENGIRFTFENDGFTPDLIPKAIMSKVGMIPLGLGAVFMGATYWLRVNRSHE
ncbi:hypothetical protein [Brumicola blandensis]|uniref:ABC transporter permease n=1 Tax=Brumicola blandensis TaxID=3075611 RepID=A0AAW8R2B8_9ALTE|nr:hypothetical protein [Alteromonas sp. W409]MDT0583407.1 hypothetical protein [Alteromonas sp. W409]